jgi:hypothetical protein
VPADTPVTVPPAVGPLITDDAPPLHAPPEDEPVSVIDVPTQNGVFPLTDTAPFTVTETAAPQPLAEV